MTGSALNLDIAGPGERGLAPLNLTLRIGLCLAGLWAVFALILIETRRHTWSEAVATGANMAALVETAITREIEVYDLSVQATVAASSDPATLALPVAARRKVLFDRASDASMHGRVLVIDADGHVVAASRDDDRALGLDLSDRDYFTAQRADPNAGLFIGGPFVSRVTHTPSLGLSRRRPDVDGRFGGVVVGTIHLDFFTRIFSAVRLPPGGSITLLKGDGTIMTRVPYRNDVVGRAVGGSTLAKRLTVASTGAFLRVSSVDDVERLFSFHRVADLPLFVNIGLSTEEIFKTWRWEMLVIGLGFALLSAVIVLLGFTLTAELQRRSSAERRLAELASTDHLTLLANRRRFDDVLELEWRRAARGHAAMSLLMVDCDHFKSFNDTYGHPAGDGALRAIAMALRTCAARTGDLVARIGGEEFGVLLPATDEGGALRVADAIRVAIDALALAHAKAPSGRLTVSVGIASLAPGGDVPACALVEAADAALYRAKREGRDRVVRHAGPSDPGGMRRVA